MITHAVVLAAGEGTRLGDLVADLPKPLLEVGGRPLIDRIVGALRRNGIERLTVVTGYLADRLETHLLSTAGVPVEFIRQNDPGGTAEAAALAREACGDAPFVLAWGDIAVAGKAYGSVIRAGQPGDDAVIGVNWVEDPSHGAAVVFDEAGIVSRIVEKPPPPAPSHWNNAGLMALAPTIWPHIDAVRPSVRGELELTDAIGTLLADGGVVRAVRLGGPWFDIGTPHSLEAARIAFGTAGA